MESEKEQGGIEIPVAELSTDALRGIVEEFVTRDGTDYGASETAVDTKVAQVMAQLLSGQAHLLFHPASETTNIVGADQRLEDD